MVLYGAVYMKCPKKVNPERQRHVGGCRGHREKMGSDWVSLWDRALSWPERVVIVAQNGDVLTPLKHLGLQAKRSCGSMSVQSQLEGGTESMRYCPVEAGGPTGWPP